MCQPASVWNIGRPEWFLECRTIGIHGGNEGWMKPKRKLFPYGVKPGEKVSDSSRVRSQWHQRKMRQSSRLRNGQKGEFPCHSAF
jgi:hypothetical protein